METIATFNDEDKAEAVLKKLLDAGIRAEIYDESKLQKFLFLSRPLAGRKIHVEEHDFDRAKELLAGLDAQEHLMDDAVHCPQCNSSRIEYPQFTRKFATPNLVEIFCVLPFVGRQFYCLDCHHTWPDHVNMEKERDPLGWPAGDKMRPKV